MGAEWGAAITAVATLAGLFVKMYLDGRPARAKGVEDETKRRGREDIEAGNGAAVSARIDSVPAAPGDSAGLGSDEDTARRLAKITGQ